MWMADIRRNMMEQYILFPTEGKGMGIGEIFFGFFYQLDLEHQHCFIALQEPVFGTVITSPLLTQTFRYILEMVREGVE